MDMDVTESLIISLVELDGHNPFYDMPEELFDATKMMALEAGGMLWVTRAGSISGSSQPMSSITTGLFRTVRSEDETRLIATLDLSGDPSVDVIMRLLTSLFGYGDIHGADKEFAEDNGFVYVQRLVHDTSLTTSRATEEAGPRPIMDKMFQNDRKLIMAVGETNTNAGSLHLPSLQFEDNELYAGPLRDDDVELKVLYTGLNYSEVEAAEEGATKAHLGTEVVGVVTEVGSSVTGINVGETVVASCIGGFASHVRTKSTLCQPIPPNISHEEAATMLTAFTTAWISLVELGRVRRGETVLIHSAAGAVGQAAVQLCQLFGLEVFATVGSVAEKELLIGRYGIPADRISLSQDKTFAEIVRRMTKNRRGVDLALNSCEQPARMGQKDLQMSLHLVSPFGRFIQLGSRDKACLDMESLTRKSASFICFDLNQYVTDEDSPQFEMVENAHKQILDLISTGKLRPVGSVSVYDYCDASKAFRALRSGEVVGKIVLRANPDEMVPVLPREELLRLDPDVTYLLSGGLGGIGRSLAMMMHSHGARNLAFISRSGDSSGTGKAFLKQLEGLGCTAKAYACDIADREQLRHVLEQCQSDMPSIRGVIQCAMVLRVSYTLFPLGFCYLISCRIGHNLRNHDLRRVDRVHAPQDPRQLEPSQPPPARPRLLHPALIHIRRHRQPRTGKLCGRQYFPRCTRTLSPSPRTQGCVTRHWPCRGRGIPR